MNKRNKLKRRLKDVPKDPARVRVEHERFMDRLLNPPKPEERPKTRAPIDVPMPKLVRKGKGWVIVTGDRRTHFTDEGIAKSTWRALDRQARDLRRASLRREETEAERKLKVAHKHLKELTVTKAQLDSRASYLDAVQRDVNKELRELEQEEERLEQKAAQLRAKEDQLRRPSPNYGRSRMPPPIPSARPGSRKMDL